MFECKFNYSVDRECSAPVHVRWVPCEHVQLFRPMAKIGLGHGLDKVCTKSSLSDIFEFYRTK